VEDTGCHWVPNMHWREKFLVADADGVVACEASTRGKGMKSKDKGYLV
jgi:hypothetical protein